MRVPDHPAELRLPYDAWWPHQQETLQKLVDSTKRVSFVIAPTGTGKTGLAVGFGRMLGVKRAAFLTRTISLQEQYRTTMLGVVTCKGKDNFGCILPNQEHKTVSNALCQMGIKCHKREVCPYFVQFAHAQVAPEVVYSYAMWLSLYHTGGRAAACDLLVMDEGHEAEKEIIKFTKLELSKRRFEKQGVALPQFLTIEEYADWSLEMMPAIANARRHLQDELGRLSEAGGRRWETLAFATENEEVSPEQEELMDAIRSLDKMIRTLQQLRSAPEGGRWFIQTLKNGNVQMVPVWASQHAKQVLEAAGRKVVIMSATLLPTDKTAKRLGLDGDYEFIEVPSTFDPKRSPIILRPVDALKMANLQEKLPAIVAAIDEVADDMLPLRGLVHTSSNRIRDYIMEHSRFGDQMVSHDGRNRTAVIERFRQMEGPPILVSPSLGTGFSGDGDIARWSVVAKYPFSSLGDGLVRLRQAEDPESYDLDANQAFTQASGRLMRAPDDWGLVFVLDAQFQRMLRRRPTHFPKWLTDRIV